MSQKAEPEKDTKDRVQRGLLVRVGIDSTAGRWNAPCSADGSFCYIPIPERRRSPNYDHTYDEFAPFTQRFKVTLPQHLRGQACHLDPDFHHLTYGDANQRGRRIRQRLRDAANPDNPNGAVIEDFIVFWASLKRDADGTLICAIIGFYRVAFWKLALEIPHHDCHRNAHTRYDVDPESEDVVVFANPEGSGRLTRYIEIGSASPNNGQQCVHASLLREWGGLVTGDGTPIKNGYIQRSNALPIFGQPEKFLRWFQTQKPKFVHANNT